MDIVATNVQLEADPVDEYDAATKGYVDTFGRRGYIELGEVDSPDPVTSRLALFAVDENGITVLNLLTDTGVVVQVGRDIVQNVKNETGSTLPAGSVVYVTGSA